MVLSLSTLYYKVSQDLIELWWFHYQFLWPWNFSDILQCIQRQQTIQLPSIYCQFEHLYSLRSL